MNEYIEHREQCLKQHLAMKAKHPDAVLLFRNVSVMEISMKPTTKMPEIAPQFLDLPFWKQQAPANAQRWHWSAFYITLSTHTSQRL